MSRPRGELPPVLEAWDVIEEEIGTRTPLTLLDYDGTLTPIVARPEDAILAPESRGAVKRLAELAPVAVVSGRGLDDVRGKVALESIFYAGSHGFEIRTPEGEVEEHEPARDFVPLLDSAERTLRSTLESVVGARVERKPYAIAVHYRNVSGDGTAAVATAVRHAASENPGLIQTGGKKVFELRPGVDWDKGRATRWLLTRLDPEGSELYPIYVGDDETDEDAFKAVEALGYGAGVVVGDDERETAARFRVRDPGEVMLLLRRMIATLETP